MKKAQETLIVFIIVFFYIIKRIRKEKRKMEKGEEKKIGEIRSTVIGALL